MTDEEVLYPSFVVGFREWRVNACGNLSSVHWRIGTIGSFGFWPAKQPYRADCPYLKPNHSEEIPDLLCSCGIYALKTAQRWRGPGYVSGRVALWGRVIEHEDGFRAQYAYPLEVTCSDEHIACLVMEVYGVQAFSPLL